MATKEKSSSAARKHIIATIRRAAAKSGKGTVSKREFQAVSGITWYHFFKHFPSWSAALAAAGIESTPGHRRIDPTLLMKDCARVARLLGRMPSRREYSTLGNFDESTVSKSCGAWGRVAPALRRFAAERREWADVLDFLPAHEVPPRTIRLPPSHRRIAAQREMLKGSSGDIACGAPFDFGPLRHEPTNEQGVIFLFALLAEKLGFLIEGFQSGAFPDCKAKRLSGLPSRSPACWRDVRIEFEYESRNFRNHTHDPAACDFIVCWRHNWPDCPLQVLALKDEVKKLKPHLS